MAKRRVEQLSEQLLNKLLAALSPEERGVLEAIVSHETSFGERLPAGLPPSAVPGASSFSI